MTKKITLREYTIDSKDRRARFHIFRDGTQIGDAALCDEGHWAICIEYAPVFLTFRLPVAENYGDHKLIAGIEREIGEDALREMDAPYSGRKSPAPAWME